MLSGEMAAGKGRRGIEGTGTGGGGEVEFAELEEGIEEAGDEDTGRSGVATVELRKKRKMQRTEETEYNGVQRGAIEDGQLAGVRRAPGARGERERERERQ